MSDAFPDMDERSHTDCLSEMLVGHCRIVGLSDCRIVGHCRIVGFMTDYFDGLTDRGSGPGPPGGEAEKACRGGEPPPRQSPSQSTSVRCSPLSRTLGHPRGERAARGRRSSPAGGCCSPPKRVFSTARPAAARSKVDDTCRVGDAEQPLAFERTHQRRAPDRTTSIDERAPRAHGARSERMLQAGGRASRHDGLTL